MQVELYVHVPFVKQQNVVQFWQTEGTPGQAIQLASVHVVLNTQEPFDTQYPLLQTEQIDKEELHTTQLLSVQFDMHVDPFTINPKLHAVQLEDELH